MYQELKNLFDFRSRFQPQVKAKRLATGVNVMQVTQNGSTRIEVPQDAVTPLKF